MKPYVFFTHGNDNKGRAVICKEVAIAEDSDGITFNLNGTTIAAKVQWSQVFLTIADAKKNL